MYQQPARPNQVQTRNNHAHRSLWKPKPLAAAIVAAVSGLSAVSLPASAQELEEIIVTATRRETAITDIPFNISVVSGEELKAKRAFGLGDLSRIIPGVAYFDEGPIPRNNVNNLILRGINAGNTISAITQSDTQGGVATYLGEAPIFANLTLKDMDRIEVLRGPQGTLYGSGAVGGTIRFMPKRPSLEDGFTWEIDANTYFTEDSGDVSYGTDVIVNIPISDQLAARVAGGYLDEGGFIDAVGKVALGAGNNPITSDGTLNSGFVNAPEKDVNDAEKWWLRASLLWQPTDNIDVNILYQHEDAEVGDDARVSKSFGGGLLDNSNVDIGGLGPNIFGCPGASIPCLHPSGNFAFPNGPTAFPAPGDNEHLSLDTNPRDAKTDVVNAEVNVDFGFATMTSSTSYSNIEQGFVIDETGLFEAVRQANGYTFTTFYGNHPAWLSRISGSTSEERITQEIRLVSDWDKRWDYTVGFYYDDSDKKFDEVNGASNFLAYCQQAGITIPGSVHCESIFFFNPGGIGRLDPTIPDDPVVGTALFTIDRTLKFEDKAFFGELTYHINDQWQITGGIRAFWQDFSTDFIQTLPFCGLYCAEDGMDPLGTFQIASATTFEDQIFKVNTSYDINDNTMAYFTWAEGFRRGGANSLPTAGNLASLPDFATYEPDSATNWEIGLKGKELFGRFTYSLAAYLIEWDNFQFSAFTPSALGGVFNGDTAESLGVELEVNGNLTENLSLDFGYAYTDAKITSDFQLFDISPFAPGLQPGASTFDGDALPQVPKHSVTFGLDYRQPLTFGNGWTLNYHVDGSFRDETKSTFNDISFGGRDFYVMESFWMLNASLTLNTGSNWDASFFIRNIGNEEGITGGSSINTHGFRGEAFNVARPRTIGFAINFRSE